MGCADKGTTMRNLILVVILALYGASMQSFATPVTFFGEDLNPTSGPPAGNIPSAIAARNNFLSTLDSAYLFDGESGIGSTPTLENLLGTNGTPGSLNARFGGDI